ncbi:MAG: hypothetical protein ABR509_00040, partial [Candidatus Limnocylindria bacterium]
GLRANAVDFATGRCRVRVKGGHERLRWIPKPARAAVAAVVAEENKTPDHHLPEKLLCLMIHEFEAAAGSLLVSRR